MSILIPRGFKRKRKGSRTAPQKGRQVRMSTTNEHSLETLLVAPSPAWKRGMDVVISVVTIIAFSPIFLITYIAVKLDSPGPAIFKQERMGLGGRPFIMYKFRTMVQDAEEQQSQLLAQNERKGPAFKIKHDPRVTRLGRVLRRYSIDEFPQLVNVFIGNMSLVGPRPLASDEDMNEKFEPWHLARVQVKPGLTCIWQVTSRDDEDFDSWMRLDLEYIRERSIRLDLHLLIRTLPAILSGKGAY